MNARIKLPPAGGKYDFIFILSLYIQYDRIVVLYQNFYHYVQIYIIELKFLFFLTGSSLTLKNTPIK